MENEIFQISPNPVRQNTTISFGFPTSNVVELRLYTSNGKYLTTLLEDTVEAETVYKVSLESFDLEKGMYIAQLRTQKGGVYHRKFVKL